MHMSISFSILQVIVIEQSILSLLDCITTKCTCEITKRHYEIPLFLFCGTKYKRIRDDGNSYMLFFFFWLKSSHHGIEMILFSYASCVGSNE